MKPATDPDIKLISTNRKASHLYEILETYEAGLVLVGTEVKSLRAGKCNLKEGYAKIEGEEAWLVGVHINEYTEANQFNHDPIRMRKLLLSKRQIRRLEAQTQQKGLTLVPIKIYFRGKVAKIEIGLGRGKKLHDKRRSIAEQEMKRSLDRETFRRE